MVSPGLANASITDWLGLAAGMGLDVGKSTIEQLGHSLDRQFLGDIDILAAAIVTARRITFRVFVGHDGALRFQHGTRDDVLRSD